MDPVTNKLLQGTPYAGMGGTQERNALIGVIRNLISEDKYTVDYILNYAQSVGYQRQMAEEVFKELTGLSPKLIVNNNEYLNDQNYRISDDVAPSPGQFNPDMKKMRLFLQLFLRLFQKHLKNLKK